MKNLEQRIAQLEQRLERQVRSDLDAYFAELETRLPPATYERVLEALAADVGQGRPPMQTRARLAWEFGAVPPALEHAVARGALQIGEMALALELLREFCRARSIPLPSTRAVHPPPDTRPPTAARKE